MLCHQQCRQGRGIRARTSDSVVVGVVVVAVVVVVVVVVAAVATTIAMIVPRNSIFKGLWLI